MRSLAYGAAILAAAGIMFLITMSPNLPDADTASSSNGTPSDGASSTEISSVTPDTKVVATSLTMNVPEMHCPFACYPSVKKNLEERSDVVSVELAPQKEEGVIDNRQVIVQVTDGFDADDAIALLETAGFAGSSVAE